MNDILLLSAPLVEKIWGGNYFANNLKKTTNTSIGEMWSASAFPNEESVVKNGELAGFKLSEVYANYPHLFNDKKNKTFPILIKLIATSDKLSVQVHPDDEYAQIHENQRGKTEGWLILDSKDSSIIIGHHAKNKNELEEYVRNDDYSHLLYERQVQRGEFYPINSGTIHAIGKDIVLLEIQQSSDLTYRFYDYHRLDKNGKERELHVKKALDVTKCEPYDFTQISNHFDGKDHIIWQNPYFQVNIANVINEAEINNGDKYTIVSVIEGEFKIDNDFITLGDSFIICHPCRKFKLQGTGKIIVTRPN